MDVASLWPDPVPDRTFETFDSVGEWLLADRRRLIDGNRHELGMAGAGFVFYVDAVNEIIVRDDLSSRSPVTIIATLTQDVTIDWLRAVLGRGYWHHPADLADDVAAFTVPPLEVPR